MALFFLLFYDFKLIFFFKIKMKMHCRLEEDYGRLIGTWNTVFYMRDSLTGHGDREFDVCVTLAALRINCVHIACVEFFFIF